VFLDLRAVNFREFRINDHDETIAEDKGYGKASIVRLRLKQEGRRHFSFCPLVF